MADAIPNTGAPAASTTTPPDAEPTAEPTGQPAATTLLNGETDPKPAATSAEGEGAGGDPGKQAGEGDSTSNDIYADFVMPEGMTLDAELLAEAVPIFKELNLTKDQAQKFIDLQAKRVQADSQKQIDAFTQQLDDWQTAAKADKEFGGDKFDQNIAYARAAVNKFGTPELKQLLEDYGVGNHPEVIRFMVRVGKLTAEDSPVNPGAAPSKPADRVSLLYPPTQDA